MSFWHSISQIGVDANGSWLDNRNILLCNRVSAILSIFTVLIFFVAYGHFGWLMPVYLTLAAGILFLTPILLNNIGFTNASRLELACALSVSSVAISVFDKVDPGANLEEMQYFYFRLMLLGAGLFPFILFQLHERKYWIIALTVNLLCIVLYDPVHHFFGVGYYQRGFTGPNYFFLNYMVVFTSLILGGSTFFLKYSFEVYERKNEILIHNLNKANNIIQNQQELLTKENIQLGKDLIDKNNQLTETNQELIQHNNELLQFSYTVSHNLRGPVASMIGLINLIDGENIDASNKEILGHVKNSVVSLDATIKDLGSIIDIRNKVSKIKQPVSLEEELSHILTLLKKEIDDQEVSVIKAIDECPTVYSVKPMINSILYNLISNAIKYRSPDRKPVIKISSRLSDSQITIDVSDNGLGLDIARFQEKIFGLYKRFHTHTEGKGIGLFLVKLQTEALGGKVLVESIIGEGTCFSIVLKSPHPIPLPGEV